MRWNFDEDFVVSAIVSDFSDLTADYRDVHVILIKMFDVL